MDRVEFRDLGQQLMAFMISQNILDGEMHQAQVVKIMEDINEMDLTEEQDRDVTGMFRLFGWTF